jgi:Zn-dependent peptidase ImmA (M78 family)
MTKKKPVPSKAKPKLFPSSKLPKEVVVFGKVIKIVLKRGLEGNPGQRLYGMYDSEAECIIMDALISERHMWVTLFHEMTHAAFDISGVAHLFQEETLQIEESMVRMLEGFAFPLIDVKKLKPRGK